MSMFSSKRLWLALVALTMALVLAIPGARAATGSEGTEFYLAFQPNYGGTGELSLFISGERDTQGTVEIPGLKFSASFQVRANQITTVAIPTAAAQQPVDKVSTLTVHVRAEDKVTVYGFNRRDNTTDGFLALPVASLGLEYYALSYRGYDWSQLSVIAAFDNTQVSITPVVTMNSRPAGKTFTITLNKGEGYMLTSSGEISGTRVVASAPVVVMAGADSAHIPTGYAYLDHIVETMTPVSTWGKSFLTVPLATRTKGDLFRVLASVDNTRVWLDGSLVATLKRGAWFERILTSRSQITASEPVLVSQFALATTYDGVDGDPFAMLIPPTEQFLDHYTFSTPNDNGFPRQFVNVVVPSGEIGSIELDGAPVDANRFSAIASSGFSGGQLPVGPGSHHLRSRSKIPFGIYVYGFGSHDSYGYPGGMSFEAINPAGDAYTPGLRLVTSGDTVHGAASDSEDADANGVLDAQEDGNRNGVIDRRDEDANRNGRLDAGEDGNGNGVLDRDSGVFRVELLADASNLKLEVLPFVPGVTAAQFTVSRIDLTKPGTGTVQVTDGAGNKAGGQVALGLIRTMKNVRVVATLPGEGVDIDMASFRTAPHSVTRSGADHVVEWRFADFSVDRSADLGFDVTLRQPLAGQKREISRSVDLYYNDETGQAFHTALEARSVDVLPSRVTIATGTDKALYATTESVRTQAEINNLSAGETLIAVRFGIRDAANVLVADLGTVPAQQMAGGASARFEAPPFALSGVYAGSYRLVADALGGDGATLATASAAFAVAADNATRVSASIDTDKQAYDSNATGVTNLRIASLSANQALEYLTVTTAVVGPDGATRLTRTESIAQLAPGAGRSFQYPLPLAGAPPGEYRAALTVIGPDGRALAASASTFTVISSAGNGAGLSGSVTALPATAPLGSSVAFSWELANMGNATLAQVPVSLNIVDPKNQAVLAQFPASIALGVGATQAASVNWFAEGKAGDAVVAVLKATVGGKDLTLAQATVVLAPPPVKVEIGQALAGRARVLALAGQERLPDGSTRASAIGRMLAAAGVPHAVVDTPSAFANALRGGSYNTLWLSGGQDKFNGSLAGELRELVFGGAGLIVDGAHDQRNGAIDALTGVRFRGKAREASGPVVVNGPAFDARQVAPTGDIVHVELDGGVAQAEFADRHASSRGPAIVSQRFGEGRSMLFALDLGASAGTDAQWHEVLSETLAHVAPRPAAALFPGALVQVDTTVVNLNRAEEVLVKADVPASAAVVDAGEQGVTAPDGRSVEWRFALAAAASKQLGLDLRMPDSPGQATLATSAYVLRGQGQQQFGPVLELALPSVSAGATAEGALAALGALAVDSSKGRMARAAIEAGVRDAMLAFGQGSRADYERAIGALVEAGARLPELAGTDTTAIRLALGRLLKETQWRWSTASH